MNRRDALKTMAATGLIEVVTILTAEPPPQDMPLSIQSPDQTWHQYGSTELMSQQDLEKVLRIFSPLPGVRTKVDLQTFGFSANWLS